MFTEKRILIGAEIAGTMTGFDFPAPMVLLVHGFASDQDEVGGLYKRLATELGKVGIASLRFDFRGFGSSAGNACDTTIDGQIADVETVCGYVSSRGLVSTDRFGIVGFSLGAGIAIITAATHMERFKSMVLWSPVGEFRTDFVRSLGKETFERATTEGQVTIDLGWRVITLKDSFFSSLDKYALPEDVEKYSGALLVISGSEDYSECYVDVLVKRANGTHKQGLIVEGADHIFAALSADQSVAELVIDRSVRWLKETL